jgi:hypothetical protein
MLILKAMILICLAAVLGAVCLGWLFQPIVRKDRD